MSDFALPAFLTDAVIEAQDHGCAVRLWRLAEPTFLGLCEEFGLRNLVAIGSVPVECIPAGEASHAVAVGRHHPAWSGGLRVPVGAHGDAFYSLQPPPRPAAPGNARVYQAPDAPASERRAAPAPAPSLGVLALALTVSGIAALRRRQRRTS